MTTYIVDFYHDNIAMQNTTVYLSKSCKSTCIRIELQYTYIMPQKTTFPLKCYHRNMYRTSIIESGTSM